MSLPARSDGAPGTPWVIGRARIVETDPRTDRALVLGVRCRLGGREATTAHDRRAMSAAIRRLSEIFMAMATRIAWHLAEKRLPTA